MDNHSEAILDKYKEVSFTDDVMSRIKLKEYQNTYAAAMAKYGLQRGIDGSKAGHVTTQEFFATP